MRCSTRIPKATLLAGALLIAACNGDGQSTLTTLDTLPPAVTPSPTTVATSAPSSTTASTASTAATTTAASLPDGVIGLSPDGPWRLVDSAPGVEAPGLVYELMPGLWVWLPVEESEEWGISWTLTEDDRPIIEAYLQARLVAFRSALSNPYNFDDPGWERWFDAAGRETFLQFLGERDQRGEYLDLDMGIVLRPSVIGDERTETSAIVFDCVLDGGVYRTQDGSLAEGSVAGVAASGRSARVTSSAGDWHLSAFGPQPEACR